MKASRNLMLDETTFLPINTNVIITDAMISGIKYYICYQKIKISVYFFDVHTRMSLPYHEQKILTRLYFERLLSHQLT